MADTDTLDELDDGLLDADVVAKSINGFDQIAIRQHFREKLAGLAEDETMFMRALLFVVERREHALKDRDAYDMVMRLPLDDVVNRFRREDAAEGVDEDDEDAVDERDRQYAEFVIACGLSFTVEQFMALTMGQRNALLDAAARRQGA